MVDANASATGAVGAIPRGFGGMTMRNTSFRPVGAAWPLMRSRSGFSTARRHVRTRSPDDALRRPVHVFGGS